MDAPRENLLALLVTSGRSAPEGLPPSRVDPVGCGCGGCLEGTSVPAQAASAEQIGAVVQGAMPYGGAVADDFELRLVTDPDDRPVRCLVRARTPGGEPEPQWWLDHRHAPGLLRQSRPAGRV